MGEALDAPALKAAFKRVGEVIDWSKRRARSPLLRARSPYIADWRFESDCKVSEVPSELSLMLAALSGPLLSAAKKLFVADPTLIIRFSIGIFIPVDDFCVPVNLQLPMLSPLDGLPLPKFQISCYPCS